MKGNRLSGFMYCGFACTRAKAGVNEITTEVNDLSNISIGFVIMDFYRSPP